MRPSTILGSNHVDVAGNLCPLSMTSKKSVTSMLGTNIATVAFLYKLNILCASLAEILPGRGKTFSSYSLTPKPISIMSVFTISKIFVCLTRSLKSIVKFSPFEKTKTTFPTILSTHFAAQHYRIEEFFRANFRKLIHK